MWDAVLDRIAASPRLPPGSTPEDKVGDFLSTKLHRTFSTLRSEAAALGAITPGADYCERLPQHPRLAATLADSAVQIDELRRGNCVGEERVRVLERALEAEQQRSTELASRASERERQWGLLEARFAERTHVLEAMVKESRSSERATQRSELEGAQQAHCAALARQQDKHDRAVVLALEEFSKTVNQEHDKELTQLKRAHRRTSDALKIALRQEHDDEIAELKVQVSRACREEHDSEIIQLKSAISAEVAQLKAEHDVEVEQLKSEHARAAAEQADQLEAKLRTKALDVRAKVP
jgi:hypothetical protein